MIIDLTQPWGWVWISALGVLLVLLVGMVVYLVIHVIKLDDLTHALNADLTTAEADIEKLKRHNGGYVKPTVQTQTYAHFYGRHARRG